MIGWVDENKKPYIKCKAFCGVGGDRTLVPTSYPQVFYMFSFWLIFDWITDKNTQYTTYLLVSYAFREARSAPVFIIRFSHIPSPKDKNLERELVPPTIIQLELSFFSLTD